MEPSDPNACDYDGASCASQSAETGSERGLETIAGNDVINFFTSTVSDGADVHAIRANHP